MKAIYQDVAQKIQQYFQQFPEKKRLPGCTHLAAHFQVNRRTVLRALHELEAQNLITIEEKRGIFLRAKTSAPVFRQAAIIGVLKESPLGIQLWQELKRRGYTPISIQFDEDAFENNPRGLLNFPVDGFLFRYSRSFTRKQAEVFRNGDRFAVSLAALPDCDWIDCYPTNMKAAIQLALSKLHEAGHRRIAWISYVPHEDYLPLAENNFKLFEELQRSDFRQGDSLVFFRDAEAVRNRPFPPKQLALALEKLRQQPEPPTALLLSSENTAGMLREYPPEIGGMYSYAALSAGNSPLPAYLSCAVSDEFSRALHAVERLVCRIEGGTPPVEILPGEVSWHPGETIRKLF